MGDRYFGAERAGFRVNASISVRKGSGVKRVRALVLPRGGTGRSPWSLRLLETEKRRGVGEVA